MFLADALKRADASVYVLDDKKGTIGWTKDMPSTQLYSKDPTDLKMMFDQIVEELRHRMLVDETDNMERKEIHKPLVLLLQHPEAPAVISNSNAMIQQYKDAIKTAVDTSFIAIYTNLENRRISYSDPAVWKMMNENRHFVLFERPNQIHLLDLSIQEKRAVVGAGADDMILIWETKVSGRLEIRRSQKLLIRDM